MKTKTVTVAIRWYYNIYSITRESKISMFDLLVELIWPGESIRPGKSI